MNPSEFDWYEFLDELKQQDHPDWNIRDGLWLFATIVEMVPKEEYNETFDYVQEELDEMTPNMFLDKDIRLDETPLITAHQQYHKMFRQIDVFYEESHIGDRYRPIDMLFYNFINSSNSHWYFFKKAVFKYVCKRDNINEMWD